MLQRKVLDIRHEFESRLNKVNGHWLWTGQPVRGYNAPTLQLSHIKRAVRPLSIELAGIVSHDRAYAAVCGEALCVRPEHLRGTSHPDVWFWPKVDRTDSCWLWLGEIGKNGYGRSGGGTNKIRAVHRFSWVLTRGPIPTGLFVLHECDNKLCCRLDHLFLGTQKDNRCDCIQKGRHFRDNGKPKAKLTPQDVLSIRQAASAGESFVSIAARFSVSRQNISAIVKRMTWTQLP